MSDKNIKTYSVSSIVSRTLRHIRPYWMHLIGITLLKLLATPLTLLKPFSLKILIDSGFGTEPLPVFITFFFADGYDFSFSTIVWIAAGLVILIALIENIFLVTSWMLNTYTGEKLVLSFRTLLFNHIQRLSLSYHDSRGTADSVYRLQYDATGIRTFLISNVSQFLSSAVTLTAMIVVMFSISWQFALIALCIMPLMVLVIRISTRRLKKGWKKVKEQESKAMSVVQEVLTSLRVVKAFGQEDGEEERFVSMAGQAVKGQMKVAWTSGLFACIMGMLFAGATVLFIYFGAHYVKSGVMTLGELTLLIAYLAQIIGPLERISKTMNDVQSSMASIDRVYQVLDKEKEVAECAHPIPLEHARGEISLHNVSFCYENNQPVLENISFRIQPGERVGIMGSTGAGKSTLINLLTRFYDPTSGEISLDGVDIRKYRLSDYRRQFALVLQEPVLFSTTIAENIAYGRPGAGKKDIIEAARLANAYDFISRCPDGFDTMVGERGMKLSGGERQRISIARAFIKNAPVLILDEPTSSLDIHTEAQIMEAMERLMQGRTSFLITHRLDTLDTCSVILHLEKGRLLEVVHNDHSNALADKKKNFKAGLYSSP